MPVGETMNRRIELKILSACRLLQFSLLLLCIHLLPSACAFSLLPFPHTPTSLAGRFPTDLTTRLHLSSNEEDDEKRRIAELRQLLESSWDTETMGTVPDSPQAAAEATAESLQAALHRSNLFLVDIYLPLYERDESNRWYDEVAAVQLCMFLAQKLSGTTAILVRDNQTIQTVERVLKARGQADEERNRVSGDSGDGEDEEDEAAFMHDYGAKGHTSTDDDIDAFRRRLASTWESGNGNTTTNLDSSQPATKTSSRKIYRLLSLFGDEGEDAISDGADMATDVVRAVSQNAQIQQKDDTIIILTAVSRAEMIAVRALVREYASKKTIILINCRLDPLPQELASAETVYSLRPLIARPVLTPDEQASSPKIVILRRYPADWQVHVDPDGNSGFELIASVPANQVDKQQGPSIHWVASCVKEHLDRRK